MKYLIYALRNADGQTIYVGQTSDIVKRLREHRNNSWWSDVAAHCVMAYTPTRSLAREVERALIAAYQPRYNQQGNPAARTTHISVPVARHAITELREQRGWNKSEFAQRVGVDRTLITRIENGQRTPSPGVIVAMAKVLGVSTLAITGEGEEAPEAA